VFFVRMGIPLDSLCNDKRAGQRQLGHAAAGSADGNDMGRPASPPGAKWLGTGGTPRAELLGDRAH
jgi:hypothetical protein